MQHPFALLAQPALLESELCTQITGGLAVPVPVPRVDIREVIIRPPVYSTQALGEEGGDVSDLL